MPTFRYVNPPVIHWGPGCVAATLGRELDRVGATRVLLVTTRSVAADPRLAPAVESIIGDRLAARSPAIPQHTPARSVVEATAVARTARIDALVSVGGGSPIDAAKAVAFSLATGLDLAARDAPARARAQRVERTVPHLAVPTTLSVAELSAAAGFSAEGTREKVGITAPPLCPSAVFYDATLAVRTPLPLWLSTGIRAVDHAVETLLATGEHPLPDVGAVEGLRRLSAGLRATRLRPDDVEARTECQLGAWFSYLLPGPAASGLSHTLGKRLGSRHGVPHGVTSCLLLPHVVRRVGPRHPAAAARIAAALGGTDAADALAELIATLDLPRHLAAWNLSERDLVEAVQPLVGPEHSEAELLALLRAAL